MKNQAVSLASMLIVTMLMIGCFGSQSRNKALFPAMELAWPSIRMDAEAGDADTAMLDAFEEVLLANDRDSIVSQWPAVRSAALAGIDAKVATGEISSGVAESLQERVENFALSVAEFERNGHGPGP